jgi:hypothetical protein
MSQFVERCQTLHEQPEVIAKTTKKKKCGAKGVNKT